MGRKKSKTCYYIVPNDCYYIPDVRRSSSYSRSSPFMWSSLPFVSYMPVRSRHIYHYHEPTGMYSRWSFPNRRKLSPIIQNGDRVLTPRGRISVYVEPIYTNDEDEDTTFDVRNVQTQANL